MYYKQPYNQRRSGTKETIEFLQRLQPEPQNDKYVRTKKKLKCGLDSSIAMKGKPHKPAIPEGTILSVYHWSETGKDFIARWPRHLKPKNFNQFKDANNTRYFLNKSDVEFIRPSFLLSVNSVQVIQPSSFGTGAEEAWRLNITYKNVDSDNPKSRDINLFLAHTPLDLFQKELEHQLQAYGIFDMTQAVNLVAHVVYHLLACTKEEFFKHIRFTF